MHIYFVSYPNYNLYKWGSVGNGTGFFVSEAFFFLFIAEKY